MVEHLDRHLRIAAELARQRPFRAGAAEQEAAEDLGAGRGAGDLFHLGLAVDREQADAERKGARDVTLLLDRVAEGDALGGGAGGEHHLDLGDRGGVEAGAERDQKRQQLGRRVCLDGIEHPAVRQRLGKGAVVVTHDVEIDDEARTIVQPLFAAAAQEVMDALGHWRAPFQFKGPSGLKPLARVEVQPPALARARPASAAAALRRWTVRWGHGADAWRCRRDAALDWSGRTRSARPARQDGQASSVLTFGRPTKKARSVVALSRVPR